MKKFSTVLLYVLIIANLMAIKFFIIDSNVIKLDFLAQHDIVNYSNSEIINPDDFELEIIKQKYNSIDFTFTKREKQNVCVIDGFESNESDKYTHGEKVTYIINRHYNGDIKQYNFLYSSYTNYSFYNCDVINYSLVVKDFNRNEDTFKSIEDFMSKYNGIMVVSSGNEGDTITQSEWSSYKNANPEKEWINRLIIVGQGRTLESSDSQPTLNIESSFGEEIDIFVPNFLEVLDGEYLTGSSFAAPVITSMVANALSVGVDVNDVKKLIISSDDLPTTNYNENVSVFNMKKSISNIENYLIENGIEFQK